MKNYCSTCTFYTNHKELCREERYSDAPDYLCKNIYSIVECMGCDTISYRTVFDDIESASFDESYNHDKYLTISNFPKTIEYHRTLKNRWYLPRKVELVYLEAINAFSNDCLLLTGVAFRALIESVCSDKDISGDNLGVKINSLFNKGIITKKESERLHTVKFLGNDAVHDMLMPNKSDLFLVLEMIEHLLNNLYLIDLDLEKNKGLAKQVAGFDNFISLLKRKLSAIGIGDKFSMNYKLFEKTHRLVLSNLPQFEKELVEKIKNGTIDYISLEPEEIDDRSQKIKQIYKRVL